MSTVKEACLQWLLVNLLSYLPEIPSQLRDIRYTFVLPFLGFSKSFLYSVDLMELLVKSQDLCVIQTEFSLYVLLKFWLYLKLHPSWEGPTQEGVSCAHEFFRAEAGMTSVKLVF